MKKNKGYIGILIEKIRKNNKIMQNKEGIFSFYEISQLRDFCNDCAKEDRRIYEERKKNASYMTEYKESEPIKETNPPSYQISNNTYNSNYNYVNNNTGAQTQYNYKGNGQGYQISNNNYNYNSNMQFNYYSKMDPNTFQNRVRMFEQ